MIAMKFKQGMSPYQAGEVAGFSPAFAATLEEKGIAERVKKEESKQPETNQTKEKQIEAPMNKMQTSSTTKRKTRKN